MHSSANKCDLFAFSTKDYPFDTESTNTVLDSVQVKPNAKQFEIRLKFNETNSLVRRKHNELVVNSKKIKEDRLMPVKLLKSNYLQETKLKYGVCYLAKSKKALDIVPVERVFDFQTDFTYLDEDRSLDGVEAGNAADKESGSTAEPSYSELQTFPLRYETNFEYSPWSHVNFVHMRERTIKEPWKRLKLVGKETKCFGKKKIRFSDQLDDARNELDWNELAEQAAANKYCLLPGRLIEEPNDDLNDVPTSKSLQLSEKINRLLINCRVIPFFKLVSLLDSDLDEELIIKVLQKSAMLVQGCWIVKSELLYANSLSELAIIHDFVSYLFTECRQLKRKEISSQIRFPLDSLMVVLSKLAKFDPIMRSWQFLYPTDHQFLAKHETVRQQMEISWQIRKLQIFKNLNLQIEKFREKTKRVKPTAMKKIELDKPIKKRLRKKRTKV